MSLSSTLFIKIKEERSQKGYVVWFFVLTVLLWFIYKFMQWRYKLKVIDERSIYIENDLSEHNGLSFNITFILVVISIFVIIEFNS